MRTCDPVISVCSDETGFSGNDGWDVRSFQETSPFLPDDRRRTSDSGLPQYGQYNVLAGYYQVAG